MNKTFEDLVANSLVTGRSKPAEKKAFQRVASAGLGEAALADAITYYNKHHSGGGPSDSHEMSSLADVSRSFNSLDSAIEALSSLAGGGWAIGDDAGRLGSQLSGLMSELQTLSAYGTTVQALAITLWHHRNSLENMHSRSSNAEQAKAREVLDTFEIPYDEGQKKVDWTKKR